MWQCLSKQHCENVTGRNGLRKKAHKRAYISVANSIKSKRLTGTYLETAIAARRGKGQTVGRRDQISASGGLKQAGWIDNVSLGISTELVTVRLCVELGVTIWRAWLRIVCDIGCVSTFSWMQKQYDIA